MAERFRVGDLVTCLGDTFEIKEVYSGSYKVFNINTGRITFLNPSEDIHLTEEPYENPLEDLKDYDQVNSPSHYTNGGTIECIDYIESFLSKEEYIGYLRGNVAKYTHRWRYKGQTEDLEKAQWYLNRLTEFMKGS